MKLTKQQIGRLQLYSGCFFLLLTIIGTYLAMTYFFQLVSTGSQKVMLSWGEAQTDPPDLKIYGETMSSLMVLAHLYQITRVILWFISAMMVFLSVMLMLQGLANSK